MGLVDDIKAESRRVGSSKKKIFYVRDGEKKMVRFLTDLNDGLKVIFHYNYQDRINVPCQEIFGRPCKYCGEEDIQDRETYVWSVYNHDSQEVELMVERVSRCSPVQQLVGIYESNGDTITDRDIIISVNGKQIDKTYTCLAQDRRKFRGTAKPYSKSAVLKILDQAYPCDDTDSSGKVDDLPINQPEDGDGWDDDKPDYDSMSPKELWKMCGERGIECAAKKSQKYYITLLEEDDKRTSDWADDEDEDDGDDWK